MELHSPTSAKKLWNILRIAFFMMRKGLVAKRKLILDMNLVMKRGKILRKSIGNLMFHYNHHHHQSRNSPASLGHDFGLREYEFSCTNSPNPISLRANSKRRHGYFSCITAGSVDEADDYKASPVIVLPRIEFSPQCSTYNLTELAPGHDKIITPTRSPLSVRVSNFSLAEEEGDGSSCEVDSRAEEFIRKFYQQLQAQGRIAMLQCQEADEYREMLAS